MGGAKSILRFIYPVVLVALMVQFTAGCKSQEVECGWCSNKMLIDGQRTDWENLPFSYFEDEDVVLGLSNDNDNLYIFFSFRNKQWARMIHLSGLTLWLNGEGKKNKDWGIRFRGGPEMPGNMRDDRPEGTPFDPMAGMDYKAEPPGAAFVILDEYNDRELTIDTAGADGPAVGIALANDIFTYEFRIPFTSDGNDIFKLIAEPGSKICIGSQWGGMNQDAMKEMGGKIGGPPRGSGGMPGGGGGMPGGGRMGGPGGDRQMPEEREIWVQTVLATAAVSTEAADQNSEN